MSIRSLFVILALCAASSFGQTGSQAPADPGQPESKSDNVKKAGPGFWSRFAVGIRARGIYSELIYKDRTLETTTVKPAATNDYKTTTTVHHMGVGPSVDYVVNPRLIFTVDFLRASAQYQQTLKVTRTSDSAITTITENTRATYWDVPVTARLFKLHKWQPRWMFVTGGGIVRFATNIKTGNEYSYPDSTTAYNETPITPAHKMIPGAVGGLGFRFIDDYRIKLVPEVRYVRWFGSTFDNLTTKSRPSGLEILVGISF